MSRRYNKKRRHRPYRINIRFFQPISSITNNNGTTGNTSITITPVGGTGTGTWTNNDVVFDDGLDAEATISIADIAAGETEVQGLTAGTVTFTYVVTNEAGPSAASGPARSRSPLPAHRPSPARARSRSRFTMAFRISLRHPTSPANTTSITALSRISSLLPPRRLPAHGITEQLHLQTQIRRQ